jgi:hypothetical protein
MTKMPHLRQFRVLLCSTLLVLHTALALGQSPAIPPRVQMLLFSSIWKFDRSIRENDKIVMAVLYQSTFRSSEEAKEQILAAVREEGLTVQCIPVALDEPANVRKVLASVVADVFYVSEMRGVDIAEIVTVSRARKIRTISVVPEYLDAGIAVGLRVSKDKPAIVVNLAGAKAEGSDLTAQLLRVSTLIPDPVRR